MTDTASAAPTYQQIVASWNARADHCNQWANLGEDEKIEWAVECAKAAPPTTGEPRWYMVNKSGMATLCADREDAERVASDAQEQWPNCGPHRAVQLVEVGGTPPAVVELHELSPDFTDTARAALLWVLWHHQGGSSPVGQPIRFALGMGQHDRLNEHQLAEAKRWERLHPVNPSVFPRGPELLTDGQIEAIWREKPRYHAAPIGVTDIEFARAIERAHGIGIKDGDSHGLPT